MINIEDSDEIWKDISGYEGLYQVSNKGRIMSMSFRNNHCFIPKKKLRKNVIGSGGYYYISLSANGIDKRMAVHRLVAQAFIPNPNNYPAVNHKDVDPSNNNVDNLEWCTNKYNTLYSNAHVNGCVAMNCSEIFEKHIKDMTGKRFGKLFVISRAERVEGKPVVYWNCLCDCGNTKIVSGVELRNGHTKSCGCLVRETTIKNNKNRNKKINTSLSQI